MLRVKLDNYRQVAVNLRAEGHTSRADAVEELIAEVAHLQEALVLLGEVYTLYEDGTACYEVGSDETIEDGAYIGNAVHLDEELEDKILAILPKD